MDVVPLRINLFLSKSNDGRKSRIFLIVSAIVFFIVCLPVFAEAKSEFRFSKLVVSLRF